MRALENAESNQKLVCLHKRLEKAAQRNVGHISDLGDGGPSKNLSTWPSALAGKAALQIEFSGRRYRRYEEGTNITHLGIEQSEALRCI